MVDHIYGKKDILNSLARPHMFINELNLYIDYLKKSLKDDRIICGRKKEAISVAADPAFG